MKKIILITLLQIFVLQLIAQIDEFSIVIENNNTDTVLVAKLNNFRASGIEKQLELDSISSDRLIASAEKYIGTPHCMGGDSKKCIDCSGLLLASFRDVNVETPHGSEAMAHYGKIISAQDSLKRGDLVFFVNTYTTKKVITHSGIYLGEGKFIHTSSRKGVVVTDLFRSKYWQDHYIFGTRIF